MIPVFLDLFFAPVACGEPCETFYARFSIRLERELGQIRSLTAPWPKAAPRLRKLLSGIEFEEPYRGRLLEAVDLMDQPENFWRWFSDLRNGAVQRAVATDDKEAIALLESARRRLSSKVVYEELKALSQKHGFLELALIPERGLSETEFFSYFQDGKLIIDRIFQDSNHGSNTHAFQILYIAHHLDKKHGTGATRDLLKYLASREKSRSPLWNNLFDSRTGDFTDPENLNTTIHLIFPYDDFR